MTSAFDQRKNQADAWGHRAFVKGSSIAIPVSAGAIARGVGFIQHRSKEAPAITLFSGGSMSPKRSTAWQSEWSVLWRLTDKQKDVLIRLSEIDFWWAERDDVDMLDSLAGNPISMLNKLVCGNDVRYQLKADKRPFVLGLKRQQKSRVDKHG